ncbi:50S ribosomal protein L4 [Thiorhodovibrio frisius]|uniref:Large ribosomal subunit protein uL4 n=1 Tax=Thiorhodovibrio frisius TaxID=631362 RepID=H8Z321_9GAMM|nr:50S ribosomal protein L4 [Thiorhodovibrio frisius]EIC21729.1 50S ribosomal protein L4, bacterial/organelle [Thiorhodovibrio frisius]WPL21697.1 50S ribosomal protein L4 [Thiorhodovibrio frisius]
MQLVTRTGNDSTGVLEVSDQVFGADYKPDLVHQVVTAYMAGARQGTKAQKNRAQVRGGGSKPYRQKGTGRARAGTTRGPLWRGGGMTFPARPRSFEQKVNRKMYRGAVRSILSELARQERLTVVPEFKIAEAKTKAMVARLQELNVTDVLIIVEGFDEALLLASRNLHKVDVVTAGEVDPVNLIAFERIIVTETAVRQLEGRLQ